MIDFFEENKSLANFVTFTILFDGLGLQKNEKLIDFYYEQLEKLDENLYCSVIEAYFRCERIFTAYTIFKEMTQKVEMKNPKKLFLLMNDFMSHYKSQANLLSDVNNFFQTNHKDIYLN